MEVPLSNFEFLTSEIHALRVEIECLKSLMESTSKSPYGTSSLAMTGKNFNSSFNVSKTLCKDPWVLDSGATYHMTPHSSLLTSYVSLFGNHITVANETHIPITGRGNVSFLPSLNLKDVLHVPSLSNNLISVKKLTRDLKCSVIFFSTHCVFQDLAMGRTIGTVKEQGGLYCFNNLGSKDSLSAQTSTTCLQSCTIFESSQIWLLHRRLGHPSFPVLKFMFPSLFSRVC